ncbi:MAG: polymerase sigma factor RpoE [Labilithrix sp.]|nr:polymerase sigma factor RpoE [Labilithrix sp.]
MEAPEAPKEDVTVDFQAVYRREVSYVIHSLRRLGVRDAELEDVAHDVFVAVYRHWADLDPARPVRPWLFGFAFRIASDHRKLARHRHEAPPLAHEPPDPGPQPDTLLEDERMRRQLMSALDAMDFDKRSLVVMHDLEGLPVPEIAALLAVPLNTAYSRLRLARAELERQLVKITGGGRRE